VATDARRRALLKSFLRGHREALRPEDVGLRVGNRRRTPGLRREEVASAADVGVTWYTFLEQGRDIRVSADALDRIAHALRLSESDTAYLFSLADVPRPESAQTGEAIDPRFEEVVRVITRPAFVISSRCDAVAYNAMADTIYRFSAGSGPYATNFLWRFFMDPARRQLYTEWPEAPDAAVGLFRSNYASRVGDPYFEELIAALTAASADFRATWQRETTISLRPGRGILTPPRLGRMTVDSVRLTMPGLPGHILFVLLPADPATEKAFARLRQGSGAHAGRNGRPKRNR
jgi:transcriptional regulator with XRE-family HTH domain